MPDRQGVKAITVEFKNLEELADWAFPITNHVAPTQIGIFNDDE